MVNRSVTWADWDEELLGLELQELNATDYDLEFTGFNPQEIDDLLALPEEENARSLNLRFHKYGISVICRRCFYRWQIRQPRRNRSLRTSTAGCA